MQGKYETNGKLIISISILLVTASIFYTAEVGFTASEISIHPGDILFNIKEEPEADITAQSDINVIRKKYTGAVYYKAEELLKTNEPGQGQYSIPPQYLWGNMPYSSEFQPLDSETLFLADGDSNSQISFKLKQEVWDLVPSGVYRGHLISTNVASAPRVQVVVIKRGGGITSFTVSPQSVTVNAPDGPDLYPAEEPITASIRSINEHWLLKITTDPLIYTCEDALQIETEDIYITTGDEQGSYHCMEQPYLLYGSNYGANADLELFLKIQTRWKHRAGNYEGEIYFTISGND